MGITNLKKQLWITDDDNDYLTFDPSDTLESSKPTSLFFVEEEEPRLLGT